MPTPLLDALAGGGGGAEAIGELAAAQRSRNLLLVRSLVDRAESTGHSEAAAARESYRVLGLVWQVAPDAARAVLNYPSVSAWLVRTMLLLAGGTPARADPGRLAAVAAAAAVRGRVPVGGVRLPPVDPTGPGGPAGAALAGSVELPSLGRAVLPAMPTPAAASVRVGPGGAVLRVGEVRVPIPADPLSRSAGWTGLPTIAAEQRGLLVTLRLDPLDFGHLPDAAGVVRRWPDRGQVDLWRDRVAAGWQILVHHHRPVAEEVAAALRVLVPLSEPRVGQVSVSFRNAFGAVAMSAPPDARSVALTLAHEVQHAKLGALGHLFPLTEPDRAELFYAPWRDDPRPLGGLLQGAYAHLGVAAFWRRQRHHERTAADALAAHIQFARWRAAVSEVVRSLLDHGRLTGIGCRFVQGMARAVEHWRADPVPDEALAAAGRLAEQHRERWLAAHGAPPPPRR